MIAMLAALLAASAASPIEHASADDCAIIAAIARTTLNWNEHTAPAQDFFAEWDDEQGGTYVQDCAWGRYGFAPPRIGGPSSTASLSITRPRYGRGRASATADVTISLTPRNASPFMSTQRCTVRRQASRWTLVACRTLAIT